MRRDDFEEAIQEAALRGAELAIRKMPKDRPTQYNRVDILVFKLFNPRRG